MDPLTHYSRKGVKGQRRRLLPTTPIKESDVSSKRQAPCIKVHKKDAFKARVAAKRKKGVQGSSHATNPVSIYTV